MNAISVENLSKIFDKKIVAIDDVNFKVKNGEIFGFLGPNGAGKTTTIKVLTTLLRPTKGKVNVAGFDVIKEPDAVRSSIGIVPQSLTLDDDLKGITNLLLSAKLYHVPDKLAKERAEQLIDMVNLKDAIDRKVETYSGGMRKRLELIVGLIHEPKILFLDEPTLGLDIQTRSVIWEYLKNLNKEKRLTIFITTHYLEEADYLCDRIGIIDKGKIMVVDSPSRLKDELGGDIINIKINGEYSEIIESLKQLNYVKKIDIVDQNLRIKVEKGENVLPTILEFINSKGIVVTSVSLAKASLDQVFLKYTGKSLRDAESDKADRFKMYFTRRSRTR
ncbi:MAG: ABC transporter ATP-binding protein [Thaumarchaeota archaeon]|nr:ABC transporter ATP-binding protein [Nitrososphaerota archaeon]|tara:strand:- start:641 stop:1639 length:999 start_codon:yes stop_codon:yes gene_type:complete